MMLNPTYLARYRWPLALVIGSAFAIVGYLWQADDQIALPPTVETIAERAAAPPLAGFPENPIAKDESGPAYVDIFAVRTWEPPPPPPAPVVVIPPPPPQAPPLPFRVIGRIQEDARGDTFLLADADSVKPTLVGTDIDARYRLEKFEGGQLYFLYRPLNQIQTLFVGTPP